MSRLVNVACVALTLALLCPVPARAADDDARLIVHRGDDLRAMLTRLVGAGNVDRALEHNGLPADGTASPGQEIVVPSAWIVDAVESSAEILYLRGEVTVRTAGGASLPAGVGARLSAGDTLATGADGSASVRLIGADDSLDHDHLYVEASSEIAIDQLLVSKKGGWRSALTRLVSGAVELVTSGSAETRKSIEVETPTAIGGVRGTEFRMVATPAGEGAVAITRLETLVGEVKFFASGEEVTVSEGFGSLAREGEPPTSPRRLPATPVLVEPGDGTALAGFEFRWETVEGAAAYVLEIAEDADFHRVVFRVEIDAPAYAPATASLPARLEPFHWRVSAVDDDGFRSRSSAPSSFVLGL